MSRRVIPQRRVKRTAKRKQPKHRMDGSFKVSKHGKYNAQGQYVDGIFFHSQAEAGRYVQLLRLVESGRISALKLQPRFPITVDGVAICTYVGDFQYNVVTQGIVTHRIIEDVKGMITPEYKLKKKLYQAKYRTLIDELPASWLKLYEGMTAVDCRPIVAEQEEAKAMRKKTRNKKKKLDEQRREDALITKEDEAGGV